jgi:pyrroline-5-carboxylate reductase
MDTITAVSGSGPAYGFYLIEAMTEAGVAGGLEAASARLLAIQTVKGAALLAAGSDEPPEVLRQRVTSPGGTTAAAVAVLDQRRVKASIGEAIEAAALRSRQLSAPPRRRGRHRRPIRANVGDSIPPGPTLMRRVTSARTMLG